MFEPLPEPPHADHFAPEGACDNSIPWYAAAQKLNLYVPGRNDLPPTELSGIVETVEEIVVKPPGIPPYVSDANYRRIRIATDLGRFTLDAIDVRALEFRPGMPIQLTQRFDGRGIFGQHDVRISVRSGDTLLIDYIYASRLDQYPLEAGLKLEQGDELCYNERSCFGHVHALRVSDETGDSVVLEPGMKQARSLGAFDIYLWLSLFRPDDGPHCIDGPEANTIEMTFVTRQSKLEHP